MKIGILALQGAFIEHVQMFGGLGIASAEVRLPAELKGISGLVIPGGESTTVLKLMRSYGLVEPVKKMAAAGVPVWGTCAGLICLANNVANPDGTQLETLGLMDITVRRNAFGRQVDSFEIPLEMSAFKGGPFPGVFIRAPYIESAGRKVEVLARLKDGVIVAARQGNLLATSFHPELTTDGRFHSYFAGMVKKR
jgi:5'-phosphate synthase pdxT subunit